MVRVLIAVGVLAWLLYSAWSSAGVERPPGILAPSAPRQSEISAAPVRRGDYTIEPLAAFELEARVLARSVYRFDAGADVAPVDIAFGWGRMSDSAVLDHLDLGQSNRRYYYSWGAEGPPIPAGEIVRSSANMHLIPWDDGIERRMKRVRPGEIVELRGALVRVSGADGFRWRSSLTRNDSGDGACELIVVREFRVVR